MTDYPCTCHSLLALLLSSFFFFFTDTPTTEIYTLSYTTLFRSPQSKSRQSPTCWRGATCSASPRPALARPRPSRCRCRSEEHTSELQSRLHLVYRLLLEKKKTKCTKTISISECLEKSTV